MEEVPGVGGEKQQYAELLAAFDAPAYVRRARGVEEALDRLLARCRKQHDEWLLMVRIRLATLFALADDWAALRPVLGDDDIDRLRALHADLAPTLRRPISPTTSAAVLRRAVQQLIVSIDRFNRRWEPFLRKQDVGPVNELRDGYNKWYVVEKACALRSDLLARHGFTPLPMLDHAELFRLLPLLPEVRLL